MVKIVSEQALKRHSFLAFFTKYIESLIIHIESDNKQQKQSHRSLLHHQKHSLHTPGVNMKKILVISLLFTSLAGCSSDQAEQSTAVTPPTMEEKVSQTPAVPEPAGETTKNQADMPASDNELLSSNTELAKQTIMSFAKSLKGELQAAMQTAGPVNAIEVCNTRAHAISQKASQENGVMISRVSLKNRSPDNAPSGWTLTMLEKFETRKAAGEDPKQIVYREIVEADVGKEFRMMKAIPTDALCLTCHGSQIAPEVAAKLDVLYPADKARGFDVGDIRGAFVVTKKL
jgi:hypothetical protein